MRPLACLALTTIALACAPSSAQVSSPAGFLSKEGPASAHFALTPDCRYMFLDGERRGLASSITAIEWRLDNRLYNSTTHFERRWPGVSVEYAPCDADRTTAQFSRVALTTPTRVFTASMRWPVQSGIPSASPAPWGGQNGGFRIPFGVPIITTGAQDLSFDFQFRGGVHANGVSFQSTRYYFDGYESKASNDISAIMSGSSCTDSGQSRSALVSALGQTFAARHDTASLRNRSRLLLQADRTAAFAPVIYALGLGGQVAGTTFPGISCAKLHVDLSLPYLLVPQNADSRGQSKLTTPTTPYSSSLAGVPIWFQAAWDDSQSKQLQLSGYCRAQIPVQIPYYNRSTIFALSANQTVGTLSRRSGELSPMFRYER